MGVALSWIAIKGVPKERALAWMNLGETDKPADPMTAELCGAQIGEWYVACAKGLDFAKEENLFNLSHECEVLGGTADEHVMHASVVGYRDGAFVWRVEYWGEDGPDPERLETDGPVPPEFSAVRDAQLALQQAEAADVEDPVDHIYDVPVKLGRRLCGFHYDPDGEAPAFKVLAPAGAPETNQKSWFARLLGK
jgi:hypothetical protein